MSLTGMRTDESGGFSRKVSLITALQQAKAPRLVVMVAVMFECLVREDEQASSEIYSFLGVALTGRSSNS